MEDAPARSPLRALGYVMLFMLLFVGTVFGYAVWRFTPLYELDPRNDQVRLLGGWIQLDGKAGTIQLGHRKIDPATGGPHFEGRMPLAPRAGEQARLTLEGAPLLVRTRAVQLELVTAPEAGQPLTWRCDTSAIGEPPRVEQIRSQTILDLSRGAFGRCRIEVPPGFALAVQSHGGRIEARRPGFDLLIESEGGKVVYERDPSREYDLKTRLVSSRLSGSLPAPSERPGAVRAELGVRFGELLVQ